MSGFVILHGGGEGWVAPAAPGCGGRIDAGHRTMDACLQTLAETLLGEAPGAGASAPAGAA